MNRILIFISALVISACQPSTWSIDKNGVGPINSATKLYELSVLFPKDSLSASEMKGDSLIGDIEIFQPGGQLKLIVSSNDSNDPASAIAYIRVIDAKFKTKNNLGPESTFGEIKNIHKIQSIDNAINSVVVSFKDTQWYITIDKKELPENIRYDYATKIEMSQIPNEAKVKYFIYPFSK